MPHFLWITLTLSRTMTGWDKMVVNTRKLKEKKINSNIIKDQHNKYRSFRRAYNIPLKYELIFWHYLISTDNAMSIIKKWYNFCKVDIEQYETVMTIWSILKLKPIKCCIIKTDFYGTFYDNADNGFRVYDSMS